MRGSGEKPSRSNGKYFEYDQQTVFPGGAVGENFKSKNVRKSLEEKISYFRELRKKNKIIMNNIVVVKRSNKVYQAFNLPKVLNVNPRSIYMR